MTKYKLDDIEFEIRRGDKFRHISLRMAPGKGIWVNLPRGYSESDALELVRKNRDWIDRHLAKFAKSYSGVRYLAGGEYRSRLHTLRIIVGQTSSYTIVRRGYNVTLYVPPTADADMVHDAAKGAMKRIYRHECRIILPDRVKALALRYGFIYNKLTFRDNISNWGSCSFRNNISLNINLMKFSDEVIDYVIIHELCHTIEKNHSERFWSLVERYCPNYKSLRKELKKTP